jgi:uncharacterized protein (TIGR04255 family)
MNDAFPFTIPERLPMRIEPCPIVEAIFEVRFVSTQPWATMPGLLFALIRERYPAQAELPLAQWPEAARRQDTVLQHLPLLRFEAADFVIQLGPRVLSLATQTGRYPGWPVIRAELEWLLGRLRESGLVRETERVGVRYIDFLPGDVFPGLKLGVQVEGRPLTGAETAVTTVLRRGPLALRLQVSNGAIATLPAGPQAGSVLDLDAWFGPLETGGLEDGLARFEAAHEAIKGVFFGLLQPELLASLKPVYA